LEVRTKAIAGDRESDILGGINQFARLKSEEDIAAAVKKQGYAGKEAEERTKFYLKGPQALCMRGGYFRGKLRGIIGAEQSIVSLSPQDFAMIKSTVKLCLSRLGYEN
jgi:hypothetical protein